MNPDLSEKVVAKIEALCTQGCSQVNGILQQAVDNDESEEWSDVTETEKTQILRELKNIMSVYDNKE
jgi:hypothetical protein